ncbi:unnamed protein product [Urochloa decumbens]|uniref:Uncharacterized protein n=2 Tax=Urochloa decumbens TaxID=240449 RepID=A0ABC9BPR6_9POAL
MENRAPSGERSKAEVVLPAKYRSLELGTGSSSEVTAASSSGEGDIRIGFSGIASRCSFSQLCDVVKGFDVMKRKLAEETGFGGLLKFPPLKQVDRRFALWLLCRVDVVARVLVLEQSRKIKLSKGDVAMVFGIPCGGLLVPSEGRPSRQVVCKVLSEFLGISTKEVRSIKVAQEVLTRSYGADMSEAQCRAFKAAFVIYVTSTVLAPGGKYDYMMVDYWSCIAEPSDIASYDWADYVLRRLFDAVVKLKKNLKVKGKVANITGCVLFLQVLYLDSLDLGAWTMPHSVMPRVSVFGPDILKSMILIDTINERTDGYERRFGKNKLRLKDGVCYSWASDCHDDGGQRIAALKNALWEATLLLVRIIRAPSEVATKAYNMLSGMDMNASFDVISALIHSLQTCSDHSANAAQPINGSSAEGTIVHAMMTAASGCVNDAGVDVNLGSRKRLLEQFDSTSTSVMAIVEFRGKAHRLEDGSAARIGSEGVDGMVAADRMVTDCCTRDPCLSSPLLHKLSCLDSWIKNRSRYAFIHSHPKHIEVPLWQLKDQITGRVEFCSDLFDAYMRTYRQRDDRIYGAKGLFRLFCESDVMASVLAGKFDLTDAALRNQFDRGNVNGALSDASMVFLPMLIRGRWLCHVWMRLINEVVIFDPARHTVANDGLEVDHVDIWTRTFNCFCLDGKLVSNHGCFMANDVTYKHIEVDVSNEVLSNSSGILCAFFCRNFFGDWSGVMKLVGKREIELAREMLLEDLSEMGEGAAIS